MTAEATPPAASPLTRRAALQILLEACYRDGDLDPAKDGTLAGLGRAIGVDQPLTRRIARSARRRAAAGLLGPRERFDPQRVYDRCAALAMVDGQLEPREIALLERLRKLIRLPPLHPELPPDADETPPRGFAAPVRPPPKPRTPKPPRPYNPGAPHAPRRDTTAPATPTASVAPHAPAPPARPRGEPTARPPAAAPREDPLARVPPLAEAGRHDELAALLAEVLTSTPFGPALEIAYRHAICEALKRVESRPELRSAIALIAVTRSLAERVRGAPWLWSTYARAAARLARELARRDDWDTHAAVARALYEVTGDHADQVAPHRARLLRDAMTRRFEVRQQDDGWALFYALRALHAAAPGREGVAREMGLALGRAFVCADIATRLGDDQLASAAQQLIGFARSYPRDLALVRRAVAAGPEVASVLIRRGSTEALERYLADLAAAADHWPGHEAVYSGIARTCERLVVASDGHTSPASSQALQLLRELRRRAPDSKGIADALVMVAAQTGISLDFTTSALGASAMPLDWLADDVQAVWQLGEELAALPDDPGLRAALTARVPDDEPRLQRAATGEAFTRPEDTTYVIDLLHEIERQLERCPGNYWTGRADWLRALVTDIGERADPRLARLATSICERQCWPEPF